MATLKSKKLQEALKKARNVGRAEEPVTIDGCSLVLQSLSSTEYEGILQENSDLDGTAYVRAHQIGHVSRSIVELEGVDLREVTVVETDVPVGEYLINATVPNEAKALKVQEALKAMGTLATIVPPDGGEERTMLVEKHEWLRQQLSTWSQEAVSVAYRKFLEVVAAGEERAKAQVQFKIPDESAEDKFRRLLTEAKELESEIPPDLAKRVLEDNGYLPKSTPAELAEIAERAREFAEEQQRQKEKLETRPQPVEEPEPSEEPVVQVPSQDPALLMKNRQRLNQAPTNIPVPVTQPPPASAPAPTFVVPPGIPSARVPAQFAALPEEIATNPDPALRNVRMPTEVAELSRPTLGRDAAGARTIIDQPPAGGLNPKFKARPIV